MFPPRAVLVIMLAVVVSVPELPSARWAYGQSDPLTSLSDEFEDSSHLASWKRHDVIEGWPSQLEILDVNTTSRGHLYMEPYTSVWYAGFRAPFLFKEATGDFVVTARVQATGKKTESPGVEGSLAGLMIREPRRGTVEAWKREDENYVSLTTGLASGPGGKGPSLEITVTVRGNSQLEWQKSRDGWVELRIARIGSSFVFLRRFEGEGWEVTHLNPSSVLGRFGGMRPGIVEHQGLSPMVQVGVTAMTDWETIRGKYNGLSSAAEFKAFNSIVVKPPEGMPDLRARFKFVRFRSVRVPAELSGRRLSDLKSNELLSFLGE